jgi:hypothetical protein
MGGVYAGLEEFVSDHHSHGAPRANATEPARNVLLTVAFQCGVVFERWVTPEQAVSDLVHSPFGVFGS